MEDDKKEEIVKIVDLFMKAFVYLESSIEEFIAYYLIKEDYSEKGNRREVFHECFLENANFRNKQSALNNIIKMDFRKFHSVISFDNLEKLRKLRNRIAHSIIHVEVNNVNAQQSKIVFERPKLQNKSIKDFTYREVSDSASLCLQIIKILQPELDRMHKYSANQEALLKVISKRKPK